MNTCKKKLFFFQGFLAKNFLSIINFVRCLIYQVLVIDYLTVYHTIPTFNNSIKKKGLENAVGKGDNASSQHFLLFPPFFLLYQRVKSMFFINF